MPPASTSEQILWHYTSGDALRAILREGVINPSSDGARWFTRRASREPAAWTGEALNEKAWQGPMSTTCVAAPPRRAEARTVGRPARLRLAQTGRYVGRGERR